MKSAKKCRFCATPLSRVMADLGSTPLANAYPPVAAPFESEVFLPLRALVCEKCLLVQLDEVPRPESVFQDYAYFSSFSDTWLKHCEGHAERMTRELKLGPASLVVEVASNDGYLLKYFKARGVPVHGVEPARNVAAVAEAAGIPTTAEFFGRALAEKLAASGKKADLILANNVLAHVPDINDFVSGFKALLKPSGRIAIEFPHMLRLLEKTEFDTIYHEHYSYLSLLSTRRVLEAHGLEVFAVEELPTHGGSLRVHARHADGEAPDASVAAILADERAAGLDKVETYERFGAKVSALRTALKTLLAGLKAEGKTVAGYGAPAKACTLLNYCGLGPETLDYTVDRSPHKQGKRIPGVRVPIFAPEKLRETRPDFVLVLPWNLKDEIVRQTAFIREWGGRHIVPVPEPKIL